MLYKFRPQSDITAHELARIIEILSDALKVEVSEELIESENDLKRHFSLPDTPVAIPKKLTVKQRVFKFLTGYPRL